MKAVTQVKGDSETFPHHMVLGDCNHYLSITFFRDWITQISVEKKKRR